MDRLELVAPKQGHKIAVMGFREEFLKAKERISGGAGLEQADNYEDWLGHKYIPHYGLVDEAVFLAFDSVGNFIGISDIRLGTNGFIQTYAGQIGYSVRPSQRRKGYAPEILRLTLESAPQYGLQKILITCNEPNIASAKIIGKNGGVLEKTIPHPGFPNVKRYYIGLSLQQNTLAELEFPGDSPPMQHTPEC